MSRSMRDDPNPERVPADLPFVGDNFARISGDAIALAKTQVYAWDLAQHSSLHMLNSFMFCFMGFEARVICDSIYGGNTR